MPLLRCVTLSVRRPSGRLEVVQLMKMMDKMLLEAGVEQQSEELTELSQVRQTHNNLFCPYKSHVSAAQ